MSPLQKLKNYFFFFQVQAFLFFWVSCQLFAHQSICIWSDMKNMNRVFLWFNFFFFSDTREWEKDLIFFLNVLWYDLFEGHFYKKFLIVLYFFLSFQSKLLCYFVCNVNCSFNDLIFIVTIYTLEIYKWRVEILNKLWILILPFYQLEGPHVDILSFRADYLSHFYLVLNILIESNKSFIKYQIKKPKQYQIKITKQMVKDEFP